MVVANGGCPCLTCTRASFTWKAYITANANSCLIWLSLGALYVSNISFGQLSTPTQTTGAKFASEEHALDEEGLQDT